MSVLDSSASIIKEVEEVEMPTDMPKEEETNEREGKSRVGLEEKSQFEHFAKAFNPFAFMTCM